MIYDELLAFFIRVRAKLPIIVEGSCAISPEYVFSKVHVIQICKFAHVPLHDNWLWSAITFRTRETALLF